MRTRNTATLYVLFVLVAPAAEGQFEGQPRVHVGKNVHVSWQLAREPMNELRLCTNPRDARDLFIIGLVTLRETNFLAARGFRSRDGGATWKLSLEPPQTPPHQADAECTYTKDGTVLVTYLSNMSGSMNGPRLYDSPVYRLPAGSTKWEEIRVPLHDGPFMSVDLSDGPNSGTIYLADDATTLAAPGIFRSTNDGRSFEGPFAPDPKADTTLGSQLDFWHVARPGESTTLLNGSIAIPRVFFRGQDNPCCYYPKYRIDVVVATDGGTRFLQPAVIEEKDARICYVTATSVAQDKSDGPYRGRLYLAYTGVRATHCEVLFTYSDDNGVSWATPRVITKEVFRSDSRPGGDHELPYLAVNKNGIVGLTWYDFRDNPNPAERGYFLRFAASRDGGDTFSRSVAVAPVRSELNSLHDVKLNIFDASPTTQRDSSTAIGVLFSPVGGNRDTNGLRAGTDGAFHAIWVDTRTKVSQVWTARVEVDGKSIRHGATALASLQDISRYVELAAINQSYDEKTRSFSADIAIRNTSDVALEGPLYLRLVGITPGAIGTPALVGSANTESGPGAVLDLSPLLQTRLAPGATSRAKRITFHLSRSEKVTIPQTRNDRGDDVLNTIFPAMQFRVYARKSK